MRNFTSTPQKQPAANVASSVMVIGSFLCVPVTVARLIVARLVFFDEMSESRQSFGSGSEPRPEICERVFAVGLTGAVHRGTAYKIRKCVATKGLTDAFFGCVANEGVIGAFFVSVANEGLRGFWRFGQVAENVMAVKAFEFGCVRRRAQGKAGRVHTLREHAGTGNQSIKH